MVAVFPNVCLWRRSYSQNWEVLTLKNIASSHLHMPVRPILLHRMAIVSFLLFRKNLGNLREFFGQMVYRPPGKKLPVRLCIFMSFRKRISPFTLTVIVSGLSRSRQWNGQASGLNLN